MLLHGIMYSACFTGMETFFAFMEHASISSIDYFSFSVIAALKVGAFLLQICFFQI